ncbi:hypothetical protein AWN90_41780 [Nocardia terpenica]|uniref:Uncharacterized protein n=1 Tax=Nocardia terpenica TaxID=455432 RepID=A0A164K5G4_9NOCA|nr:hypothetical protein AWN90_41780 [Nocardia terpenica]
MTDAAVQEGFSARTVTVAGWMDHEERILGYLHHVTVCGGEWVLDGTARQFGKVFPAAWVAPTREYLDALAGATRVEYATFLDHSPFQG